MSIFGKLTVSLLVLGLTACGGGGGGGSDTTPYEPAPPSDTTPPVITLVWVRPL